jgi:hypothetical protein
MNTPALKPARMKPKSIETIKLSVGAQKLFAELSKKPPPPTAAMKKLRNLPDFASRAS